MLEKAGGKAEDSAYVAETLVNASLAGVDSHGIIRMERYVSAIEEGSCLPLVTPEVLVNKGSMALIDGKNTFGQIVARQAMEMCIEKVAEHGLALVSCVNTGHVGRVGEYALTAAKKGYVAYCCVNGGAIVAPFGSKARVWGTNPICCAVPVADGEPLLVDLATSIQAEGAKKHIPFAPFILKLTTLSSQARDKHRESSTGDAVFAGKVMSALHKGAELPEDTIINKDGQPSKVPRELYDGGTIMTVGGEGHGHKGSALSMMVDVLGGVLSGTGPSFGVDPERRPQ